MTIDNNDLEQFIVAAKAECYVGDGASTAPSREGSHDLGYEDGEWRYLDSYFGGTDFLGQEVVWHRGTPVWAMNYYGYILREDMIDASRAGNVIKVALASMYQEKRFLGGFEIPVGEYTYADGNTGDVRSFQGVETITLDSEIVYRLDYHGGLVKP